MKKEKFKRNLNMYYKVNCFFILIKLFLNKNNYF